MTSTTETRAELAELRATVRRAALAHVDPHIAAVDRDQLFSPALWHAVRACGVFDLPFDPQWGGQGGTFTAYLTAIEEVSRVGAFAGLLSGTTVQVAEVLIRHAHHDVAANWVPRLVSGEALAAWAFTEPATGSDPKQIRTRAVRQPDGWDLSGEKTFISLAGHAQVALVFATTEAGRISAFLTDTSLSGWNVAAAPRVLALGGGEPATVQLDHVLVAPDHLVGGVGDGFALMLDGESRGKLRAAAICVGIAQRALDEALAYAQLRTHRGTPIANRFAGIQRHLVDIQVGVLEARAVLYAAAELVDNGQPHSMQAAACRITAGRAAREATSAALEVGGAYGLVTDSPLERLYREGKFFEVAQGSVDIQRAIIARQLVGEID